MIGYGLFTLNVDQVHAVELTMNEWFVSGHDFSRAEKLLFIWASAPAAACILLNGLLNSENAILIFLFVRLRAQLPDFIGRLRLRQQRWHESPTPLGHPRFFLSDQRASPFEQCRIPRFLIIYCRYKLHIAPH